MGTSSRMHLGPDPLRALLSSPCRSKRMKYLCSLRGVTSSKKSNISLSEGGSGYEKSEIFPSLYPASLFPNPPIVTIASLV